MALGLGIDTGGTNTDAAVVDLGTMRIWDRSVSPTTRDDLTIGISRALDGLDRDLLDKISLVSLSSTLATNTIVEGKGGRAGLICIGRGYSDRSFGGPCCVVKGAHDLDGNETEPLDEAACREFLQSLAGRVDAVAVSGYLSVRNPAHEDRAAFLAREILGVPVVCGHELSSGLGFNERTTTALMNARLIPVIAELIRAMQDALRKRGIDAPLMMVKGDGSVMSSASAVLHPVETVLSGPASSLVGAYAITGEKDMLMVDVGGTTTDIGLLKDGFPRLEKEGAAIGGRRTRVLAAAMSTFGIGGDSRILVNGTRPMLTPLRVIPVCAAAERWPHVGEILESLEGRRPSAAFESVEPDLIRQETELFVAARPPAAEELTGYERNLLERIRDSPMTAAEAESFTGTMGIAYSLSKMERLGLVTRIGVTPTDLLHADGSFTEFDAAASKAAIAYLARKSRMTQTDFVAKMEKAVVCRIATCIMEHLLTEEGVQDPAKRAGELVAKMASRDPDPDYTLSLHIARTIVGIGAPVQAWLPPVADMFGARLVISGNADIGNAVGAVAGMVTVTEDVLIRPAAGSVSANPACIVFTKRGKREFPDFDTAVEYAKKVGAEDVRRRAAESGAGNVLVEYLIRKKTYRNEFEGGSYSLLEANVLVRASGKPSLGRTEIPSAGAARRSGPADCN
ncbi:hydantoinase/oxoprolinase N-terminal domain-containing protein [Candidatus Methanomethylophilus sp. 1R26]|uniref:hydantoinase/oxoprolinase N-terminal domain-containing protein n=1 Tax=Candidatus Methanomethylophilus sp. 1R26 TaxID=1769296 RepID=UPI0009EA987C|nr:hydantoinase/oxoprolinase family protein [Candidatus Methanomethylophilus sp. 1R26]